ncbi:uncharacterized protein LOC143818323 [Ranitomeya variabilis]|uniref:uncharacterized protein LOC143818323 n=1 Tax=Ranitomeya variabilis TaxID=490064 RepID=UPI0040566010
METVYRLVEQQIQDQVHADPLPVQEDLLSVGQLVLVRIKKPQGKLRPKWETEVYRIIGHPYPDGPVYQVQGEDSGSLRTLHRNMLRPCRSQPDSSPVIPREMDITNTVGDTDTGDVEVEDIPTLARLTDASEPLASSTDLPTGAESGVTDRGERLAPVRRTARTNAGVPPGQSYRDQYVWPSSQPGPTTSTAIAALESVVDRDCQPSSGGACNELAGSDCSVIIDIESVTDTAPVWPEVVPMSNVITGKQTVFAKLPPAVSCDQEGEEEKAREVCLCRERSVCDLASSHICDIGDCLDDSPPLKADFQIVPSSHTAEHSAVTSPQILNPRTVSGSSVERPNIPPLPAVPQGLQFGPERWNFV